MKIVDKPVDVVAYFDGGLDGGHTTSTGKFPVPKRMRVQEVMDSVPVVVKIDKIISVQESRICGVPTIIYLCQSEVNGLLKRYELKYEITVYRWRLYKI